MDVRFGVGVGFFLLCFAMHQVFDYQVQYFLLPILVPTKLLFAQFQSKLMEPIFDHMFRPIAEHIGNLRPSSPIFSDLLHQLQLLIDGPSLPI